MQNLGLLRMYFDAVVVEIEKSLLFSDWLWPFCDESRQYPINNYLVVNIGRLNYVQISNVRSKLDYSKSWFYILNICNNLFELLCEFLQRGFSLGLLF